MAHSKLGDHKQRILGAICTHSKIFNRERENPYQELHNKIYCERRFDLLPRLKELYKNDGYGEFCKDFEPRENDLPDWKY